jgi:hypothetical protein
MLTEALEDADLKCGEKQIMCNSIKIYIKCAKFTINLVMHPGKIYELGSHT